jgi:penicillin-binding protein 2
MFFLISIIFARIGWLQIVKGDYYFNISEGNRIRIERVEAKRGIIYDRNKQPLVRNVANFLLYFVPVDLPKDETIRGRLIKDICQRLGSVTEIEINEKLSKIKLGSLEALQPLFITDNIPYEVAMQLYLESQDMPGVVLSNKSRREYNQYSKTSSHILGYTGKINEDELSKFGDEYLMIDYIGKTGIEYFWENELKGKSGKKEVEVNAMGKKKKDLSSSKPEDGHNLVLALDIEAQKKLEDVIGLYLEKYDKHKASAVLMDPNNGEILSLVGYPGYDNNLFAQGISQEKYDELLNAPDRPLFNRPVSGEYPSGSTIKPVISAAALQEGVINEKTSVSSVGGIWVGQWFFPDWKAGGHGTTDVRKALAQSVNTFYYYIGGGYDGFQGLGIDRIVKYGKLFGLGEQTGIDIAGEASGFLPTKEWKESTKGEAWYIGDTYHAAIGQGDVLVTPLQVALYTSVFANNGKLFRPHLVKDILDSEEHLISHVDTTQIRDNFISEKNINIIREGMRLTVTGGSAQSLQAVPVPVAGKTGTAQWSTKKDTHAWFTGFAPYEKPEVVITILIEEGGEGSSVAVPIAKEFLSWYFGDKNLATSTPVNILK